MARVTRKQDWRPPASEGSPVRSIELTLRIRTRHTSEEVAKAIEAYLEHGGFQEGVGDVLFQVFGEAAELSGFDVKR
jgi:hypothetical protein